MTIGKLALATLLAAGLSACATSEANIASDDPFASSDPYEPTNRRFHNFNVSADRSVLRPIARGYDQVTPSAVQFMVGNALNHLDLPRDFANHLLQGELLLSVKDLTRLTINTVIGVGFLDPATELGFPKETTDFGVTLGKYGVAEGPYLVLPLLGPTNPRDLTGTVVDRAFSPLTYVSILTDNNFVSPAIGFVSVVDRRNRNADLIDELFYERADSYVSLRSVYLQRRRALVDEGDELPDIFDQ